MIKTIKKWLLLILIAIIFFIAIYFRLFDYINFKTLKQYHEFLLVYTEHHYFLSVGIYIFIYTLFVSIGMPVSFFFSIAGGFLFGNIAIFYVLISATIGATILFYAVRTAIGDWLSEKAEGVLAKMEKGFQENAFNYLLFLRLIPIFPFWLVNIVAALFDISVKNFIFATFLGIIPGCVLHVLIGKDLHAVFNTDQTPDLSIFFKPSFLVPVFCLAGLVISPTIYRMYKSHIRPR